MVHIHKSERNTILYYLLKNGVLTLKKEFVGQHSDTKIDNLKVWMLAKSLNSKGYLNLTFNWRHYYYTLNQDGIEFIKKILGINDDDVKPETHKARNEPEERRERRGRGRGRGRNTRGRTERGGEEAAP